MVVMYFIFQPQRQGVNPFKSKPGTSPKQRALRVKPGEWRGWPHRVGTHARQGGRGCRRWLGRLHPVDGNQGAYRARKLVGGMCFVLVALFLSFRMICHIPSGVARHLPFILFYFIFYYFICLFPLSIVFSLSSMYLDCWRVVRCANRF